MSEDVSKYPSDDAVPECIHGVGQYVVEYETGVYTMRCECGMVGKMMDPNWTFAPERRDPTGVRGFPGGVGAEHIGFAGRLAAAGLGATPNPGPMLPGIIWSNPAAKP